MLPLRSRKRSREGGEIVCCLVERDLKRLMLGSEVAAATVVPAAMQCAKVKEIRTERSSRCSPLTAADCLCLVVCV